MAKPIIHHRTKAFEAVMAKVRQQLKSLFQTRNEVLIQASVGSGGMEAAVVNCFSPGEKVIVVRSGKFGERWSEQCKTFGLNVIDLDVEWGKSVEVSTLKSLLEKHKDTRGVLCQACETSTGARHPIEEMGSVLRDQGILFLVDAITALGIYDIKTDEWGLDVVITGSQKALMLPPGLALISFSPRALKKIKEVKSPRYYFDVEEGLKAQGKNQTFFTPAISLIQGLAVSLDMIEEETLSKLFARHQRLAQATRESIKAMGLKLFTENPADSITAVQAPPGIDGETVVRTMQEKYNITIIGGQDHLKGKIFRLGHMGYCGDFDVIGMISATEMTLKDLGYSVELGTGVAAAMNVLYQGLKECE